MAKLVETVKTPDVARYMNIPETEAPDTAVWEFIGVGFNSMSESPNAQSETKQYISERQSTSDMNSYQPQWAFDTDLIKNQLPVMKLYDIAYYRKVGADAQLEILLVDLFQPIDGQANTHKARKQLVSVEVSGLDGEPGQTIHVTGNLNAVGDQVVGTFNTTTKAFTAGEGTESEG